MSPKKKISPREKINKITENKIVVIPDDVPSSFGKGRMLIPRPVDIEKLVKKVKRGKVLTKSELRRKLAEDAGADFSCPLTTGIFLRIVSEAAEEELQSGAKNAAPYWRVIGDKGELNEKFPIGTTGQSERLKEEGITLEAHRSKERVIDFEKHLVRL